MAHFLQNEDRVKLNTEYVAVLKIVFIWHSQLD